MRLTIISDMHGNCVALDAVLADIQQKAVEDIVCLGDAVQGGPQPAAIVARLRQLACPVVMGNADAWLGHAEIFFHGPVSETDGSQNPVGR